MPSHLLEDEVGQENLAMATKSYHYTREMPGSYENVSPGYVKFFFFFFFYSLLVNKVIPGGGYLTKTQETAPASRLVKN